MQDILAVLGENVWIRLAFGLVLGGFIGLEREFHGRPAGFRTHILVCLGAVILIVSAELLIPPEAMETRHLIAGRIIAGIITGIGFLGAGVIVRMGDTVRGLTTAASIWFTAALGVVIGEGLILLALIGTGLILLVLTVFNKLDVLIPPVIHRKIIVCCDQDQSPLCYDAITPILDASQIRVQDFMAEFDHEKLVTIFKYHIHVRNHLQGYAVTRQIATFTGVRSVRWEV
jgi:putative Mg2+ transporter-C (MgtC) family protein